jgi:penicillin amidase
MRRFLALMSLLSACLQRDLPLASDFESLSDEVVVLRDRTGIPHIYGTTDADVACAAGYEHARDRLFQMDLLRRMAQGRMAEVLGEHWRGTHYADQDHLLRAVGFARAAQETIEWLRRFDHQTYAILSAYAAGVSAFIEDARSGRTALPYGFRQSELGYLPEPWRPVDSVSIAKLQTWALSSSVSYELLTTLIRYVVDPSVLADLVVLRPMEPVSILSGFPPPGGAFGARQKTRHGTAREHPLFGALSPYLERVLATARALAPFGMNAGSNNWVVSGEVTATGKPILCNDPHLTLFSPANFYLLHLNTADAGGDLDVAGVSFPGAPVVVIGHNRRAAWGATVARADVSDIFAEKLSSDRQRTVHDSGEEPLLQWTETIRIRRPGAPVTEYEERQVTLQIVPRHGPVLPPEATIPPALAGADLLSMSWTGLGVTNELGAFVRLNRVRDVQGFRLALEEFWTGAQNIVYADADGHIAYYAHARYPIRRRLDPENPPWYVLPGSGAYDWTGRFVPSAEVPQALDPVAKFLATANNDPMGLTFDGDPLNDALYLGPLYDAGYRAWRITTELERLVSRALASPTERLTGEMMKTLQTDTYLRLAERLRPQLLAAWAMAHGGTRPDLAGFAQDQRMAAALTRLAAWDLRATAESGEAALFHLWLGYFGAAALRDEIGGAIYDRAVEANLDVLLRPLVLLYERPESLSGHDYFDDIRTTDVETREWMALGALRQALDHGARLFGTASVGDWRWSRIHTATLESIYAGALEVGPVGLAGGVGSVNVAEPVLSSADNAGGPPDVLRVTDGPNLRMVVVFDAQGRPSAEVILPGGQSGVPGEAHFADQVADWAAGRYRRLLFRRAEIEEEAESRVVFRQGFPRVR